MKRRKEELILCLCRFIASPAKSASITAELVRSPRAQDRLSTGTGGLRRPFPAERLESKFHSQLHSARRAGRVVELAECRIVSAAPASVKVVESFPVEGVVHLPPELHSKALRQNETLRQVGVPVVPSGIEQSGRVPSDITLLTLRGSNKLAGIQVRAGASGEACVRLPGVTPVLRDHRVVAGRVIRHVLASIIPRRGRPGNQPGWIAGVSLPDPAYLPTAEQRIHTTPSELRGGVNEAEIQRMRHIDGRVCAVTL
jgi:hypothetical protein